MHVAMIVSNPYVADQRVQAEAQTLAKNGYSVTVIAWDRECRYLPTEELDGIRVRRIHQRATYGQGFQQITSLLSFWKRALGILTQENSDIIHCHDLDTLPVGWLAARRLGAKLIYDSHECYPAMFASHGGHRAPHLVEWADRWLSKRVDAVITVGELLATRFRAVTDRPVYIVGNWKNPNDFQLHPEHKLMLAQRYGVGDRLVVSYIGGLNKDRVLLPLIKAIQDHPQAFLFVAGDGTQQDEVRSLMAAMENGVYLGRIPTRDVPQLAAISDVIYYALAEGYPNNRYSAPNALFTALAAGKALVTTDVGEIAHIVRDVDCGIVLHQPSVPVIGRALKQLADSTCLRRCQRNAKHAAETKYNWDNAQRILLSIYREL